MKDNISLKHKHMSEIALACKVRKKSC